MKKLSTIKWFSAGLMMVISFSSCLKNNSYYTDFASAGASIQLPLAANNQNGLVTFSYDATVPSVTLPIYVNVASPKKPTAPVTATLGLDTAYLNQYNNTNGTSFEVFPDSTYTINKWNVTVPAGQRMDSITVTFNFSKLNLSHTYVLPITIKQASIRIEQWNHLLLYVSVKNKYDGHYKVTGTMVDRVNAGLTGYYPWDVYLVTTGPNSVRVEDPTNGPIHLILSGTSLSYYGSFGVGINFDPSGNGKVVSVVNIYGQPASNTRSGQLDPTGANQWDPTTHNMDIKYFMLQPSVVPTAPYIRTTFDEHYEYLGPR